MRSRTYCLTDPPPSPSRFPDLFRDVPLPSGSARRTVSGERCPSPPRRPHEPRPLLVDDVPGLGPLNRVSSRQPGVRSPGTVHRPGEEDKRNESVCSGQRTTGDSERGSRWGGSVSPRRGKSRSPVPRSPKSTSLDRKEVRPIDRTSHLVETLQSSLTHLPPGLELGSGPHPSSPLSSRPGSPTPDLLRPPEPISGTPLNRPRRPKVSRSSCTTPTRWWWTGVRFKE